MINNSKKNRRAGKKETPLTAVVANTKGEIFELDGYGAVGMAGSTLTPLTPKNTVNLPYGGELMFLPNRRPILYNISKEDFEILEEDPYAPGEAIYPVASFNSPGYVNAFVAAYTENNRSEHLPLFSYGAVGWHNKTFRSAVIQVDKERRQDLRLMPHDKVIKGVNTLRKKMPDNRLRLHLERCALEYGCPAAKNFYLHRYEAPLPTSKQCNAGCLGCISLQKDSNITPPQDRIDFTPTPKEIAQIALWHMEHVERSVVSFGQGCEGDPLMAADVIEPAIKKIRLATTRGTINMNTNGSKPKTLEKLFNAGLDSIRISMNSARKACYNTYFEPKGYDFSDVEKSIDLAIKRKKFVSINYLNCPGVTDSAEEVDALIKFLTKHPINLIQWRNLNFDPFRYWQIMCEVSKNKAPIGMGNLLQKIHKIFPDVKYGYFNPPKETFTLKKQ